MPTISPSTKRSTQLMTMDLRQRPDLEKQTRDLLSPADHMTVTSKSESVEASLYLQRVQQLRKWITGIYKEAKQPLTQAKKTLDAQEHALVDPIKVVEQRIIKRLLTYTTAQAALEEQRVSDDLDAQLSTPGSAVSLTPTEPFPVPGMHTRTVHAATVTDLRALALAVAGQLLLDAPGCDERTARWIRDTCKPTPQATIGLLAAAATAVNALARALKSDLDVPGVALTTSTTIVSS
tara:strand:+ start:141 stop:848 length:708 start_codon:yes stop_codon:yes gene_type:complete